FNFRGVGRSEGVHDGGDGETGDAMAALDWITANNPDHGPVWLAGFSFGAWIASKTLMQHPGIKGFVLVAPGAMEYDWSFFDPCPCDGLIVQGSADDIVPADSVVGLAEQLQAQGRDVRLEMIDGAGHLFEIDMALLQSHVTDYISDGIAD
ncbi:MAG: alpha/beta hydrolase, partial [Rhodospirillaceae bacterium]|nr:alpha/beta hydrolase [Rhodospirillaceae bacterium]